MPVFNDWPCNKLLHARYVGEVSGDEIEQGVMQLGGDARLDTLRYVFADWREASNTQQLLVDSMRRVAVFLGAVALSRPGVKVALLININNPHSREAAAQFELDAQSGPWAVKCFEQVEQVYSWLGIDPL